MQARQAARVAPASQVTATCAASYVIALNGKSLKFRVIYFGSGAWTTLDQPCESCHGLHAIASLSHGIVITGETGGTGGTGNTGGTGLTGNGQIQCSICDCINARR